MCVYIYICMCVGGGGGCPVPCHHVLSNNNSSNKRCNYNAFEMLYINKV